jgi:hypothetical protein
VRVCFALLALLGAFVAAGSAGAVADSYNGAVFHPFTMPGTPGCVAWTDAQEGTSYNCDPVNLIFPRQSWTTVRNRLQAKGWTTLGLGSTQYLHFDTTTLVPQSVQLFRSDGPGTRYHMRLWQTGTTTLGGVHHEAGTLVHTIDKAWDASEAFVRSQLCGWSCSSAFLAQQWAIQDGLDGVADFDLLWRGWANDGYASVIPSPTLRQHGRVGRPGRPQR